VNTLALVTLTREQLTELIDEAIEKALSRHAVPAPEILNSKEAGRIIGRSAKVMERLARAGEVPAYRLGPHWRFKRAEVQTWATKGGR
jgi:excisionase family DNA binding protein